jgi:hypothetical protein
MKIKYLIFPVSIIAGFFDPLVNAQSVWNDGGLDASWTNSTNWTGGIPTSLSNVTIGVTPTANTITLDTSTQTNSIASLTFGNGIGIAEITPLGVETLSVSGNITNSGSTQQKFSIALTASGSAAWSGPLLYANTVDIGANSITLSGVNNFTGSSIGFTITNASTYGKFLGSFSSSITNATTVNISSGSYVFLAGDTFDFTTSSFGTANIGTLPTLTGGMTWNTTSFISNGVLSVVAAIPEPSTYGALFGAAVIGFGVWRKRRKA